LRDHAEHIYSDEQQNSGQAMSDDTSATDLLSLTAKIVSAHVGKNATTGQELPVLIRSVHAALAGAGKEAEPPAKREPAVPPRRSVFPDYLICLEDGKKLKTLKRHLSSAFNLTPAEYRERWDLPADYPMVAPNYAKHRSELAKQLGLGRKPAAPPEPAKKSGRGKRAGA
jgi:predicted transcriptional regulator